MPDAGDRALKERFACDGRSSWLPVSGAVFGAIGKSKGVAIREPKAVGRDSH
jgi:hypothetical protein